MTSKTAETKRRLDAIDYSLNILLYLKGRAEQDGGPVKTLRTYLETLNDIKVEYEKSLSKETDNDQ